MSSLGLFDIIPGIRDLPFFLRLGLALLTIGGLFAWVGLATGPLSVSAPATLSVPAGPGVTYELPLTPTTQAMYLTPDEWQVVRAYIQVDANFAGWVESTGSGRQPSMSAYGVALDAMGRIGTERALIISKYMELLMYATKNGRRVDQ